MANNVINQHTSGANKPGTMISTVINSTEISLRLLACGSKNCAGIEEKTNKIHYFPQSTGYSYVFHD